MKENVLRGTQFMEDQISTLGREASRLKSVVSDKVEDSLVTAKRAVKRGYDSAEDLIDEASHSIKRYPLRSVIGAFAIGAVAGWLFFGGHRRF
jgi:ElaB/YqjD/DUF883 family membrane-anchored ribosome-binding protein